MAIVLKWFRALRLSYWRRCHRCSLRGSKCLCRRATIAMEQIFFAEERKNKLGARNFSHVSDTAISASTSGSGSGSGTMLSSDTSFGPDYGPGEFLRATQQQQPVSTSTVIVRKNSGTMVPMRSQSRANYSQDDIHCNYSGEFHHPSYHQNDSSNARHRARRQLPPSTTKPSSSTLGDDSSLSLQVYSRKQQRAARSASRSSARMNPADSLIVRPSTSGTMRPSVMSDRMSIDNNTGSYNPQSRFFGASYAPSIQEDEDDVQARLNGLLLMPSPASSTSTILERSRYCQQYY